MINNATSKAIARLTMSEWYEGLTENVMSQITSAIQREYEANAFAASQGEGEVDVNEAMRLLLAQFADDLDLGRRVFADVELTDAEFVMKHGVIVPEPAPTMTWDEMERMIEMCHACYNGAECDEHDTLILPDGERMFPWIYCDSCDLYRHIDIENSGSSLGFAGGHVTFTRFVGCTHVEVDESDDVRAAR